MKNSIRSFFAISLTLSCLNAALGATLFDNFEVDLPFASGPGMVIGPRPDNNGDRLIAQPFSTDNTGQVASASILMERLGSPTGTLYVDIWDEVAGQPGSQVGRIGSFDITTLPNVPTVLSFSETFSLTPNTNYYLVSDSIDVNITDRENSFRFGMVTSDEGTRGAGRTLVTAPNTDDEWLVLGDLLPGANYLRMSINTVPEPTGLSIGLVAFVALAMVRRRCDTAGA